MKTKTRSKEHKKISRRTRTKRSTGSGAKASLRPTVPTGPNPVPSHRSGVKACEEVEVGDVGGFGSTEELEAHEKRCGQEATEFCNTCSKNLCSSHYELLHKDHASRHDSRQGLTGQYQ